MFLSEFQKSILTSFKLGENYDIYKFIKNLPEITETTYQGHDRSINFVNITFKESRSFWVHRNDFIYTYKNKDFGVLSGKILEFIFLCNYLEDLKLLKSIKLREGDNIKYTPILKDDDIRIDFSTINDPINQLAFERFEWVFLISPALKEFIQNDFHTNEEVHLNAEAENRIEALGEAKKSRNNTRNFAIASLIITLFASGFSIYYSHKNVELFTNERKISIVEDKSRKDTNKVLLIGKETIYDTIKVNETNNK